MWNRKPLLRKKGLTSNRDIMVALIGALIGCGLGKLLEILGFYNFSNRVVGGISESRMALSQIIYYVVFSLVGSFIILAVREWYWNKRYFF